MAASAHASVLRRLLHSAVTGEDRSIGDIVTEDVVGWSPNLTVASRDELLAALDSREEAFSGIELSVHAIDEIGDKAIAEWHVVVDHTGRLVIDDITIAPTGRRLHLSGATFVEFDGDRICAFRNYFDDLALIEQILTDP